MIAFFDWLKDNWLTVLSILVGILATWTAYRIGLKDKRPCYSVRNVTVIEAKQNRFPSLEIHYKGYGQNLDNFSVAIIAFWNAGRETIDKKDIVSLTIRTKEGYVVLDASVIQVNKVENKFSCVVSRNRDCVNLAFDYLDCNQGAVIEVLHTATDVKDVGVVGTIKGAGGEPKRVLEGRLPRTFPFGYSSGLRSLKIKHRKLIIVVACLVGFLVPFGMGFWTLLNPEIKLTSVTGEELAFSKPLWSFQVVLFISSFPYLVVLYKLYRRLLPKGLDKYFEDL